MKKTMKQPTMKKVIILVLVIGVSFATMIGCSANKLPDTYIRPMVLSSAQQEIVDLMKMNNEILLLEYHKTPNEGVIEIEALCYTDGELIQTVPVFSMAANASESGKFVLNFNKEKDITISLKETSGQGFVHTNVSVPLDFIDGDIMGWSHEFLNYTVDLEENNAPIIGYYVLSEDGIIRASSMQDFEANPEKLKENENIVLFRMHIKE